MMAAGRHWRRRYAATARAAFWIAATGLAVAGCEDAPPAPPASPAPVAEAPAQPAAAPAGIVLTPQPGASGVALTNDPSAPADTPLCGMAAREADAIAQGLLPRQYATAGICSGFACYDPATATYLGADGYRHVCR